MREKLEMLDDIHMMDNILCRQENKTRLNREGGKIHVGRFEWGSAEGLTRGRKKLGRLGWLLLV